MLEIGITLLALVTILCIYDSYESKKLLDDVKKKIKRLKEDYDFLNQENRNYYEILKKD